MSIWELLITIGIVILIIFLSRNKEGFSPEDDKKIEEKNRIAKSVLNFIDENTTYKNYLDHLISINNVSYNLLEQEVFFEFKFLKKNKKLTQKNIFDKMSDF